MIICNLPVLLAERRLKVTDAVRATGISQSTLHKLYHAQTSRIDFETIGKLCELLNIEVGELLKYVPDQKHDLSENSGLVSKLE
ncbi:MAG: helix-turn-helix transcriptional regulator [Candidatus Saccharibacteria bacterium]|nr:helix-turn-helix transcriptional regulator [Moraxellaceae bacterium]